MSGVRPPRQPRGRPVLTAPGRLTGFGCSQFFVDDPGERVERLGPDEHPAVNEQVVANFNQQVSGDVTSVKITPGGITAGLKGKFATTVVDLGVPDTPGIVVTPVLDVPTFEALKPQGAKDALVGLSDDSINMMFASLTAAGKLSSGDAQGCFDTGANVGSLLPPNCNDLNLGDDLASATARGYCHAIRSASFDDCDNLLYNGTESFFTATERGVCHGARGDVCSTVSPEFDLVEITACNITPNFNLHADKALLFCAKGDVPPRMLFPNTGIPGAAVPTALRLNDLTVALVVDRSGNLAVDDALAATPGCFAGSTAVDCNLFAACLDINLNFSMEFLASCPANAPGFKSTFNSIQLLNREVGVVCSGSTSPTTDSDVLGTASDDLITIPIAANAADLSPDICGAGLDLGGFVSCASPSILTIEADSSPALRDYLAITCDIR